MDFVLNDRPAGVRFNSLRGNPFFTTDLRVTKKVSLEGRRNAEAMWEMFNVFKPSTSPTSTEIRRLEFPAGPGGIPSISGAVRSAGLLLSVDLHSRRRMPDGASSSTDGNRR